MSAINTEQVMILVRVKRIQPETASLLSLRGPAQPKQIKKPDKKNLIGLFYFRKKNQSR